MNVDLVKELIIIAITSSIFSTGIIQKIKEQLKTKRSLFIISFVVSIVIVILFSLSFTNINIINSLWVGLITWLEADMIYKTFEDKIFKSFSSMNDVEIIKRNQNEY